MKYRNKWIAAVLAMVLLVASTSMSDSSAAAASENYKEAALSSTESDNNGRSQNSAEISSKEEVVYVMTDASGQVSSVNVVNIFGPGDVTDYGDYSSVQMLTSNKPISQKGDVITFSTDEERVYYQGTMENAAIPWNISITYFLDGKCIEPEKLAGQSGRLEIKISIKENIGCRNKFFDNYALQTTFTLNTENCENIKAPGATMANVGNDKQYSYTILPGKGLDTSITAKVTDFEMEAVTINGIKLNLNIEVDDDELMEKVSEIMDAAEKLNDGAAELNDGASDLCEGGSDLLDGMDALYEGEEALDDGIYTLADGIDQIQEGLDTLNEKSSDLTEGSAKILDALETIQERLADVSVPTDQLKKLRNSSSTIKQGISDLYTGAVKLQRNLSFASYSSAMNSNGLNIEALKAGNSSAIATLTTQIEGMQASVDAIESIADYESNSEYAAQIANLEAQIESLSNIATLLSANNAAIGGTESYLTTLGTGVDELVQGLASLKTNYATFDDAIVEMTDKIAEIAVDMSSLKSAIDKLVKSYHELDDGIGEYTDGVATIVANYMKLVDGVNELAEGSRDLMEGTATLMGGAEELYDGMTNLYDGTTELFDGTTEFYDKTSDMDVQVQNKIDEIIASIVGDGSESVSFVSDKNTDVESVQFVIKTDSIRKASAEVPEENVVQKKTLWQKILALFGL